MRHTLYYLLPDIECARKTLDDLLLNRIEEKHIHFVTGGTMLPPDLPDGTLFHKTDVVHGASSGMIVGGILGIAFGFLLVYYYGLSSEALVVLVSALVGVLFGGWAASMVAAALPNTRLKSFYPELERGKILLIVDVPARKVEQIEKVMADRHPEMKFNGEEPNVPVFP
ncbi:hypothetical protein [Noviherbaspirillum massiliense]|uniref:hypothetical protein n=1 Tax=Noviherbaspirillum massiliense TaxID=1465823 RepID=UPI000308A935|nr:hypothetical protein [Noviherbaspirillum massiliense]